MQSANEHLRRWRLILGGDEADGTGYTLQSAELEAKPRIAENGGRCLPYSLRTY